MIERKENLKEKNYRENGTENDKIGSKDSHKNMEICSTLATSRILWSKTNIFFSKSPLYAESLMWYVLWDFEKDRWTAWAEKWARTRTSHFCQGFSDFFSLQFIQNLFIRKMNFHFYTVPLTLVLEHLKFRSIAIFIFWVGLILGFIQLLYYFR